MGQESSPLLDVQTMVYEQVVFIFFDIQEEIVLLLMTKITKWTCHVSFHTKINWRIEEHCFYFFGSMFTSYKVTACFQAIQLQTIRPSWFYLVLYNTIKEGRLNMITSCIKTWTWAQNSYLLYEVWHFAAFSTWFLLSIRSMKYAFSA